MKAVLDTNVLVSAALVPGGNPHQILESSKQGGFELVTSEILLDELESVLARRHIIDRLGWSDAGPSEFVDGIRESSSVVEPTNEIERAADPDDNRVLEAAVEGEVDYIVTGDRHLLELKRHDSIEIVTPADFLAILAEARNP
jgi:uncharacterized protein